MRLILRFIDFSWRKDIKGKNIVPNIIGNNRINGTNRINDDGESNGDGVIVPRIRRNGGWSGNNEITNWVVT